LLARSAGVQFTHIPYRGSAPAMNDLMGGQISALMESLPTAIGYFSSGRMRPLAVSEDERSPSLPDVPTFREAGIPERGRHQLVRLLRNRGHSTRARQAMGNGNRHGLAKRPGERGLRQDRRAAGHARAEGYTDLIKGELARWRVVIRDGNIRAD